ncbi:MAG: choice-of-anchor tandem repeat GloVer-containing protein [Candidatus Sulfotelmatobacter sp.]|jgi:uncharacterized repeat protein (TIGR03803 family)
MRRKKNSLGLTAVLAIFIAALLLTGVHAAAQEKVLYSFMYGNAYGPSGSLVFDAAGNLYGVTGEGGAYPLYGTVFELSRKGGGGWAEKVLHSFNKDGKDGYSPNGGLIFDAAGNLYGTTVDGGFYGWGTVFELSPGADGRWKETILHNFNDDGTDGQQPLASLIWDAAGNLYGTTINGGANGGADGTVFELTPATGGGWTEKILYNFGSSSVDGTNPEAASVIFDATGNLYGTTAGGGAYGQGIVFELTPQAGGNWTETVLYNFNTGAEGYSSDAGLIFDAAGNLYGTTFFGGQHDDGTVFEMAPQPSGSWTYTVLHSFGATKDGAHPYASLIFDPAGNLYGTTNWGGAYDNGTVFKLTSLGGGNWAETFLHSFSWERDGKDGYLPQGSLIFDASGNLYGTTIWGGGYYPISGSGTVFEIKQP